MPKELTGSKNGQQSFRPQKTQVRCHNKTQPKVLRPKQNDWKTQPPPSVILLPFISAWLVSL